MGGGIRLGDGNGSYRECPFFDNQNREVLVQIEETHAMITNLQPTMQPISKLNSIDSNIAEMKAALLAAATGRDQVPVQVVQSLFKMMGWIVFGLVFILVFVLTGHHLGWISL